MLGSIDDSMRFACAINNTCYETVGEVASDPHDDIGLKLVISLLTN